MRSMQSTGKWQYQFQDWKSTAIETSGWMAAAPQPDVPPFLCNSETCAKGYVRASSTGKS